MHTHPDFEDFLRLLEANRVEYMIVGGYAVAYHGFPRFTKDLDIFFADDAGNLERLQSALIAFGFQATSVPLEALGRPGAILAIGIGKIWDGSRLLRHQAPATGGSRPRTSRPSNEAASRLTACWGAGS